MGERVGCGGGRGARSCAPSLGERGSRSGRGGEGVVLGRSHSQERESRLGAVALESGVRRGERVESLGFLFSFIYW